MDRSEARQVVMALFARRRRAGLSLGVNELLAALSAVSGAWNVGDGTDLQHLLELLWCKSAEEIRELESQWDAVLTYLSEHADNQAPLSGMEEPLETPGSGKPFKGAAYRSNNIRDSALATESVMGLNALPVKAPFAPLRLDEMPDFSSYGPVSPRSMSYGWRSIRRPLPDGPADILDVLATAERAAQQGFYIAPVYRRRERNHAHLVLLIDQNGSMMPFHRLNRDIVTTAQSDGGLMWLDTYYFHNIPSQSVYLDPHLTQPYELKVVLGGCTPDTLVLIVSDAGAARGYRNSKRIQETMQFLGQLKQATAQTAWLNPMPQARWEGSSAELVARFVPMFGIDSDGFEHAIDVLRGQISS